MTQTIPVFCINLARSPKRLAFMDEQLKRLDIPYERFEAVDGFSLSPAQLELYSLKQALKVNHRELYPTEIGCALSHIGVWELIRERQLPEALILEDDILIGEGLNHLLANMARLPNDYELMNLITDVGLSPFGDPVFDIFRAAHPKQPANRLGAYLLTGAGAAKLLKHAYPVRLPSDGLTGRTSITGLIHYAIYPCLVAQSFMPSDTWFGSERSSLRRSQVATLKVTIKRTLRRLLNL